MSDTGERGSALMLLLLVLLLVGEEVVRTVMGDEASSAMDDLSSELMWAPKWDMSVVPTATLTPGKVARQRLTSLAQDVKPER